MGIKKYSLYSLLCISIGLFLGHVISPSIAHVWASSVVPAAYNLVQNGGVNLTRRTTINCTGTLTCSDSGSVTTFAGGGAGGVTASIRDTQANIAATACNASIVGQVGFTTDSVFQAQCNGTSWQWFVHPIGAVTLPGVCANYGTGYNNGANWTCTDTSGTIFVDQATNATQQWRGIYKATPGTPWTKTMCWRTLPPLAGTNSSQAGMFITDGTKAMTLVFSQTTGASNVIQVQRWTTSTTIGTTTNIFTINEGWVTGSYACGRIGDDGATLTFSISQDGINWPTSLQVTEAVGTTLTPSGYGFGGNVRTAANDSYMTIVSYN